MNVVEYFAKFAFGAAIIIAIFWMIGRVGAWNERKNAEARAAREARARAEEDAKLLEAQARRLAVAHEKEESLIRQWQRCRDAYLAWADQEVEIILAQEAYDAEKKKFHDEYNAAFPAYFREVAIFGGVLDEAKASAMFAHENPRFERPPAKPLPPSPRLQCPPHPKEYDNDCWGAFKEWQPDANGVPQPKRRRYAPKN